MARKQASFLFIALALGIAAALTAPGCLIPDYCIEIHTPGTDWCRSLPDAQMWPSGQPQAAKLIFDSEGGSPTGCVCLNDAEQQILMDQAPAAEYDQPGNYVAGANIAGFEKVASAMLAQGVV